MRKKGRNTSVSFFTGTPERILKATPLRNESVWMERRGRGAIVWSRIQPRWWMAPPFSWFLPFRSKKGFGLDAMGLEVWDACSGNKTVEQIIDEFSARHKTTFHEARLVVAAFLKTLTDRKLIALSLRDGKQRDQKTG